MEHDIFEHRSEKHRQQRNELNERAIGSLTPTPIVVVQGIEIKKPSWFNETELNLDQMMTQMGNRRNK